MVTKRVYSVSTRYASATGERILHPCATPSTSPLQTREMQSPRLPTVFLASGFCLAKATLGAIFSTAERLERPTWQWQVLRRPHGLRAGPILDKNAWGWCWNRKKIGCQSQAHSGHLRVVRAIKHDSGAILSAGRSGPRVTANPTSFQARECRRAPLECNYL